MPRKPPAEPIDHHYDIPRLNRAFTWTAVALTAVFVWMVIQDYSRDWKTIQRTFMRLDAKLTREAAIAARRKAIDQEHTKLVADLRASRAAIAQQAKALRQAQAKLKALAPRSYLADQEYKFTKAAFDAALYKYEDALANKPKAAASAKKDLDGLRKQLEERTVRLATLKKEELAAQTEIDLINARRKDIETTIEKRTAEFRISRQKYAGLKQDTLFNLRNSPILDMINPVPPRAAGAAAGPLHQRQLHADPEGGPLHHVPRGGRPQGLRRPEDPRGLPDPPAHPPHGRERVHAPGQLVRMHALPWRPGPGDVVLVGRSLAPVRRPEGRLDEEVRLGVRPVQREPRPPAQVRRGRLLPLSREGGRLPRGSDARLGDAGRRVPRLLGLPPDRRPRETGPPEGRSVARAGRRQGPAGLDDAVGHGPRLVPAQHEDADLLLPRELRRRLRTAPARSGAEDDERARPDREQHDGQRHRGVPLRQVEARRRAPGRGAGRRGAGREAPRRPGLLRLPRGGPEGASAISRGPTGSSDRTSRASGRKPRGTGSTTGS